MAHPAGCAVVFGAPAGWTYSVGVSVIMTLLGVAFVLPGFLKPARTGAAGEKELTE